ncbi:hypothetical protein Trydic_g19334 [Trypoxylus dichotomus]
MARKLLSVLVISIVVATTTSNTIPEFYDDDHYMHSRARQDGTGARIDVNELETDYWLDRGQATLGEKINRELNKNIAKNVIMFLGDGMSISTLKAARVWLGQSTGEDGETTMLAMEDLPFAGLSKTYCLDAQVADSACSATAYLAGIKANDGTIGVNGKVKYGNCTDNLEESNFVYSIGKWSQDAGKRTGVVTTTRVTHASPAGVYAHIAHRDWESVTPNPACRDIAFQLVHGETGKNLNVILGGGRRNFLPNSTIDEEGSRGARTDGRNLIQEWLESKVNETAEYVWNRTGLLQEADQNDYLLGLFQSNHMEYYLDVVDDPLEPTLAEMTEAAIKILSKGENGYFLFVEGGKIDTAHHDNNVQRSLAETVEFSKAIQVAKDLTSENDTLIVVTSDHSHVFTFAGYAARGTNVMGPAGNAKDNIPYTILSYANGPGYRENEDGSRYNFSQNDFGDIDLIYPALAPLDSETHAGEEVGIFARGPWAHLFSGVMEQNVIPHLMAYASCVGDGAIACKDSSNTISVSNLFVLICLSVVYLTKYMYNS